MYSISNDIYKIYKLHKIHAESSQYHLQMSAVTVNCQGQSKLVVCVSNYWYLSVFIVNHQCHLSLVTAMCSFKLLIYNIDKNFEIHMEYLHFLQYEQ